MPTQALNTMTLYEARHKRKPHLAGIQEFGVTAYVKDLWAGKLDSHAQVGRFVGYDTESKGYQIYWPVKRTVTVEHNVTFNENDVLSENNDTIIQGEILNEGEQNKILELLVTQTSEEISKTEKNKFQ